MYTNQFCGGPWQRWRLHKVTDVKTGFAFYPLDFRALTLDREVSYNIVNALNDKVLDIHGVNPQSGKFVSIQPYHFGLSRSHWEFANPIVDYPPGWFHMQNVGTGELLSHANVQYLPVLLPVADPRPESQYRSTWQFQWTLCHSGGFKSPTAGERNSWHIINRLTRIPLCDNYNSPWKLELDTPNSWRLTSRVTSVLLTQSEGDGGVSYSYHNRVSTPTGGRHSWALRLLDTCFDNSPFRCGRVGPRRDTQTTSPLVARPRCMHRADIAP